MSAGNTLTDVFNIGLIEISEKTTASSDVTSSSSVFARRMALRWQGVVRGILEQYPLNFAIVREQLNVADGQTSDGFDYVYEKPGHVLRIEGYTRNGDDDEPVKAREEGGYIVSNSDMVNITYVSAVFAEEAAVGAWPQLFCDWLGYKLARIVAPTTLDKERIDRIDKLVKESWDNLTVADAQQTPKRRMKEPSSWNAARTNIYNRWRYPY
jgi:hypothetical protein